MIFLCSRAQASTWHCTKRLLKLLLVISYHNTTWKVFHRWKARLTCLAITSTLIYTLFTGDERHFMTTITNNIIYIGRNVKLGLLSLYISNKTDCLCLEYHSADITLVSLFRPRQRYFRQLSSQRPVIHHRSLSQNKGLRCKCITSRSCATKENCSLFSLR